MAHPKQSTDPGDTATNESDFSKEEIATITAVTLGALGVAALTAVVIKVGAAFLLVVALLILGHYVGIAVHEIGHLVAGRLADFVFVTLQIGPLQIVRTPQGPRPELHRPGSIVTLFSGSYVGLPSSPDKLTRRILIMISGGPLASLLLIALLIVLWRWLPPGPAATASFVVACWWGILCVLGLIPAANATAASDGMHILHGVLRRADTTCIYALMQLYVLAGLGQRPRDWDARWIDAVLTPCNNSSHEALANHLAYYWSWDRGNLERTRFYLDRAVVASSDLAPGLKHSLLMESAFYHAAFTDDLPMARERLRQAIALESHEGFDKETSLGVSAETERIRAEAAILLAEGRVEEAHEKGGAWLALHDVPSIKMAGMRLVEREWIEAMVRLRPG